jgi:hypothetical protein
MSLKDKASLIFKPSRYKAGTAYSFRGTDFTFSRSGNATRNNTSGYIEEVGTDIPRLDYDPTDLTKDPTLVTERASTNLVTYSSDMSNGRWEKGAVSVLSNSGLSPDNTLNADAVIEDTSSNPHRILTNPPIVATGNQPYSFSVYVKPIGSPRHIYWMSQNSSNGIYCHFDMINIRVNEVSTSGFGSSATASIVPAANGFYRLQLSGYPVTSTADVYNQLYFETEVRTGFTPQTYTGDGVSGFYVYGWQVENLAAVTGYIPTVASTVTRNADASRITTLQSAKILSASAGTFMIEVDKRQNPIFLNQKITVAGSSTISSLLIDNAGDAIRVRIWNNSSSNVGTITTDSFPEGTIKYLIKWDGTNTSVFANGKFVGSAAVPNYAYAIYDMYEQTTFSYSNTNEALFFPSALSDEECISLTSFDDYEELVDAKGLTWESPTITNNRLTALAEL